MICAAGGGRNDIGGYYWRRENDIYCYYWR